MPELTLLNSRFIGRNRLLKAVASSLRGSAYPRDKSNGKKNNKSKRAKFEMIRRVDLDRESSRDGKVRVALPLVRTDDIDYMATIDDRLHVDSSERYKRLCDIVVGLLASKSRIDYVVFPELSIPRRWHDRLMRPLLAKGISVIAGLEYKKSVDENEVIHLENQVVATLTMTDSWPATHVHIFQNKCNPAHEERKNIKTKANPESIFKRGNGVRWVISHGGFHFGMMICSELTNCVLRSQYRGSIDALFVVEWNRDTETFSSIIEASSFDLHCFVIQVNNSLYGDSRIRAPYKESFMRDIVKIKGGINSTFVVGEIYPFRLRHFQENGGVMHEDKSNEESSAGHKINEFKPIPDGYILNNHRRSTPLFDRDST